MKTSITTALLALACGAGIAAAQAQSQQTQRAQQQPGQQQPAAGTTTRAIETLVGCLYREDQVPGRTPNVAERAGVFEDYILADARSANSAAADTPTATTGNAASVVTTLATGPMYEVERISADRLKGLVGKRVEITGRVEPLGGPAAQNSGRPRADSGLGPDAVDLPELEATSIREVAGSCPATPRGAK